MWGLASQETLARLATAPVALLAAVTVAAVVGIALALHERLQEIEKGEEDEAKKY